MFTPVCCPALVRKLSFNSGVAYSNHRLLVPAAVHVVIDWINVNASEMENGGATFQSDVVYGRIVDFNLTFLHCGDYLIGIVVDIRPYHTLSSYPR